MVQGTGTSRSQSSGFGIGTVISPPLVHGLGQSTGVSNSQGSAVGTVITITIPVTAFTITWVSATATVITIKPPPEKIAGHTAP